MSFRGCLLEGRGCGFALPRENVVCLLGWDLSRGYWATSFLRLKINDLERKGVSILSYLSSPAPFLRPFSPSSPLHSQTPDPCRKMPAYHHPPAHRLTVPLILLLLTAGGLVLTTIRSYPTQETINNTIQKAFGKPTQTSLNDLFDTIGSQPDRESTADYNYCQAKRPDTKSYPALKVIDAFILPCSQEEIMSADASKEPTTNPRFPLLDGRNN